MSISPFTNSSTKGLIAVIHDIHTQYPKFAFELLKFCIQLASNNTVVASYLLKQRKEISWMEQFLESKMESSTTGQDVNMNHFESDNEGQDIAGSEEQRNQLNNSPVSSSNTSTNQKKERDSTYLVYLALKKLVTSSPQENEPNHDRELELVEELEQLKRENSKLREALEFFKKNYPSEAKLPSYVEELFKVADQDHENELRPRSNLNLPSSDEEENLVEMNQMSPLHFNSPNNESSSETNAKAKQLVDIFGSLPMAAALLALKKMNFDLESAAALLSDDIHFSEIVKEAALEEAPVQQTSYDTG